MADVNQNALPRVSIIMVTADHHQPFIQHAIQSVLQQTLPHWELMIVDDGPSWLVSDQVRQFADPRIHYLSQDHVGVGRLGETYNRGMAATQAPIIAILEGDDYWPSDKLAEQLPAFEHSDAVLSYGIVVHVTPDGVPKPELGEAPQAALRQNRASLENNPLGQAAVAMAKYWQYVSPSSLMIRRDVLQRIGGFNQPSYYAAVDFPTVLALAFHGRFLFLPRILGYGRHHPRSVTARAAFDTTYLLGMLRCWYETAAANHLVLSAADVNSILRHWRRTYWSCYWLAGRYAAVRREHKRAFSCFAAAVRSGPPRFALLAVIGFLAGCGIDPQLLERLYRFAGKKTVTAHATDGLLLCACDTVAAFDQWEIHLRSLSSGSRHAQANRQRHHSDLQPSRTTASDLDERPQTNLARFRSHCR